MVDFKIKKSLLKSLLFGLIQFWATQKMKKAISLLDAEVVRIVVLVKLANEIKLVVIGKVVKVEEHLNESVRLKSNFILGYVDWVADVSRVLHENGLFLRKTFKLNKPNDFEFKIRIMLKERSKSIRFISLAKVKSLIIVISLWLKFKYFNATKL